MHLRYPVRFCFASVLLLKIATTTRSFLVSSSATSFPEDPFAADALTQWIGQPVPRTCFEFEGGVRCYFTFVPSSCDNNSLRKPVPLVVDIHSMTCSPTKASWYTGWKDIAERECFVVMWPSGYAYEKSEGVWNIQGGLQSDDYGTERGNNVTTTSCCYNLGFGASEEPHDTLFLKTAIDQIVTTLSDSTTSPVVIDNNRIYVTGHSNGAIASLAMAGLYSDTIAAVAIFAGALATPFAEDYSGVPIWWVHGSNDSTFPYNGAPTFQPYPDESIFQPTPNVGIWSMDQTLEYLYKQNRCSKKTVSKTNGGSIIRFDNCRQEATVELLTLDGIEHHPYNFYNTHPPGYCEFDEIQCLPNVTTVKTTELAWAFISSHSKTTIDSVAKLSANSSCPSNLLM